jgi:hypothetical protein
MTTTTMTSFTSPTNAKTSADHLARGVKGYPPGFGQWPKDDQHAHHAAAAAVHDKKVITRPANVKPANINKTPNSDMGDRPPSMPEDPIGFPEEMGSPQMDVRPYELPTEARPPKFNLVSWNEITFDADAEWLIKHILPRTGVALLYGQRSSFKSFVAMHMAICVALGRTWAGKRVERASVVYIAAEGQGGFPKRQRGYIKKGLSDNIDFHLILTAPNLGSMEGDLPDLIAAVEAKGVKPGLIVVDTVAKSIGGAEENGAGMAAFVWNAGALAEAVSRSQFTTPAWGKLKIRVKSGHKAISNGSGCGLSGFGRFSMSRANLPKRRICSRI